MKPSILYLNPTRELGVSGSREKTGEPSLTNDLCLDRLLTEQTLNVLITRCTPDERKARLEIFALFDNSEHSAKFERMHAGLVRLAQLEEACNTAQNRLEGLILTCTRFAAYVEAVGFLADFASVNGGELLSRLAEYAESQKSLCDELSQALEALKPVLAAISGSRLTLSANGALSLSRASDENLTARLEELIAQSGVEPKRKSAPKLRINEALSDALGQLLPDELAQLRALESKYLSQLDKSLPALRRESEFYLEITSLITRAKRAGMPICRPEFTENPGFSAKNACDFTLLVKDCTVIANDIEFDLASSVSFLTGANGGGKTTYLRCVGANLILALAGCPIFARSATLSDFTRVCTHFPADESFTDSGRLVEEKRRVDSLLSSCAQGSFVFMNETFSGTDDIKGAALTLEVAKTLKQRGAFCLWVTHFHEVSGKGFGMLTTVIDESDSAKRTFRIERRQGDGSSYARDILKKYRLDDKSLAMRGDSLALRGDSLALRGDPLALRGDSPAKPETNERGAIHE